MLLERIGSILRKNSKSKLWWIKLGLSIIVSNIFFFILFSNPKGETRNQTTPHPEGVEVQVEALLLTPFQTGKKILVINRRKKIMIAGVLQTQYLEDPKKFTVLVNENEAGTIFHYSNWEILPYLKKFRFKESKKEKTHEIYY